MEELLKQLQELKPAVDFTSDSLVDSEELDSLDIVDIISMIEANYDIEIEPDQIDPDNFQSVEAMWRMISGS